MKIISKGTANKHDLVHVTCKHCGTNVTFWRGEPNTCLDYINSNNGSERFHAIWECPICGITEDAYVDHVDPIYDYVGAFDGVEKDRILTVEEKAEMEEAIKRTEE